MFIQEYRWVQETWDFGLKVQMLSCVWHEDHTVIELLLLFREPQGIASMESQIKTKCVSIFFNRWDELITSYCIESLVLFAVFVKLEKLADILIMGSIACQNMCGLLKENMKIANSLFIFGDLQRHNFLQASPALKCQESDPLQLMAIIFNMHCILYSVGCAVLFSHSDMIFCLLSFSIYIIITYSLDLLVFLCLTFTLVFGTSLEFKWSCLMFFVV